MGAKQTAPAVTTVAHWCEWKEKCAAGRCSAEARAAFGRLGRMLYTRHLQRLGSVKRYGGTIAGGAGSAGNSDAWHILETYAIAPRPMSAKVYKDYILDSAIRNGGNPAAACQTAAGLVMRSALRKYALDDCPDTRNESIYEPGRDGVALIDVLLPPTEVVFGPGEEQELRALAAEMAPGVFGVLSLRERVSLLATGLCIPTLADPRVTAAAECSYQRLYEAHTTIRDAILGAVEARFSGYAEDSSTITLLARMISEALHPLALSWGRAEKACAPLF